LTLEYNAIAIILIGGMFFLMEMGSRIEVKKPAILSGTDFGNWIKLFFIGGAFLLGIVAFGMLVSLTDEAGASAEIKAVANAGFWGWMAFVIVAIGMLIIYYLVMLPRYFSAAAGLEEKEKEDNE
jgi:hypothetical protein